MSSGTCKTSLLIACITMYALAPTVRGQKELTSPRPSDALPPMGATQAAPTDPSVIGPSTYDQARALREVLVPSDQLEQLLSSGTRRILLNRDEFEALKRSAKLDPKEQIPVNVALVSAEYSVEIHGSWASIQGHLTLDVLASGLQAFPLQLEGCSLMTARSGERAAQLAEVEGGGIQWLVEGKGTHRLTLTLLTPVQAEATQQSLNIGLPQAAAGRMRLTVPGNVEVKAGGAVLQRKVDTGSNRTELELLMPGGRLQLLLSLNNHQLQDQSAVASTMVLASEIRRGRQRLLANVELDVLHGAIDRARFRIPDGWEVSQVNGNWISRWEMQRTEEGHVLEISLQTATADKVQLFIELERQSPEVDHWSLAGFLPLEVAHGSAWLLLSIEEGIELTSLKADRAFPIDATVLQNRLGQLTNEPSGSTSSPVPVAAFFLPDSEYRLQAKLAEVDERIEFSSTALVSIHGKGIEQSVMLNLVSRQSRLFEFELVAPEGWTIKEVMAVDGQAIDIDFPGEANGRQRAQVHLEHSLAPNTPFRLRLTLEAIPTEWLDNWESKSVSLSPAEIVDATALGGMLAVQARDEMEMTPVGLRNVRVIGKSELPAQLESLDATALLFRNDSGDWALDLEVRRAIPSLSAHVLSFVRIQEDSLVNHTELIFQVTQSKTRRLSFSYPTQVPPEIGVRTANGIPIKEMVNSVQDNRRRWDIELDQLTDGELRLLIDFTLPGMLGESVAEDLPIARAEQVDHQSGSIAVEGIPELDVEIESASREIDIGEMSDAVVEPGRYLLGVYGYAGQPTPILVRTSHRPPFAVPAALVERAQLTTTVSSHGVCQTSATYSLRTKAANIALQLPEGAVLWSAMVDKRPATAHRVGDITSIAVTNANQSVLHELQLVYQQPIDALSLHANLQIVAPELFESESDTAPRPVPVATYEWQLVLPNGYIINEVESGEPIERMRTAWKRWQRHFSIPLWNRYLPLARHSVSADVAATTSNSVDQAGTLEGKSEILFGRSPAKEPATFELDLPLKELADRQSVPPQDAGVSGSGAGGLGAGGLGGGGLGGGGLGARPKMTGGTQLSLALGVMQGTRSLPLSLNTGMQRPATTLRAVESDHSIRVTVVHHARLQWLAWTVAGVVLAIGLALTRSTGSKRLGYCASLLALLLVVPLLSAWLPELTAILAICPWVLYVLVVWYGLSAVTTNLVLRLRQSARTPKRSTAVHFLITAICLTTVADQGRAQQPVNEIEALRYLIESVAQGSGLSIPEDVVVVPYEVGTDPKATPPNRVLVPLKIYELLRIAAQPTAVGEGPFPYAWKGGNYAVALDRDDTLLLRARLYFDVLTDRQLAIPLPIEGCVVESATVDGQAALLKQIEAGVDTSDEKAKISQASKPAVNAPLFALVTRGRGEKVLEIRLRCRVERGGGWYRLNCRVPAPPAASLDIAIPKSNTEVRMRVADALISHKTSVDNQHWQTSPNRDGRIDLQWRTEISVQSLDKSLAVSADSVMDVREDSIRMTWRGNFEFRGDQRESLGLTAPDDWLVERVLGDNVRGWSARIEGQLQRLDVQLMKPAIGRESLIVVLSRASDLVASEQTLTVPQIDVPESMLQQGQVTIRHSELIDVQMLSASGAARVDAPEDTAWLPAPTREEPVAIRVYQSFRYLQVPFSLSMLARAKGDGIEAAHQSLLRISQRETTQETRITIRPGDRPVYELAIELSNQLELQRPEIEGQFRWVLESGETNQKLRLWFADGRRKEFSLVLRCTLRIPGPPRPDSADSATAPIPFLVPHIKVLEAKPQLVEVVIQSDPAYAVRVDHMVDCESSALALAYRWLAAPQRELARILLRAEQADFQALVTTVAKSPEVTSQTVSNVRVTERYIEETILFDATISNAGIREYQFDLPDRFSKANVRAPLLSRKVVTTDSTTGRTRFQLLLQDEVIGEFRVVVTLDRSLEDLSQEAPIPHVLTGGTRRQLITLENSSRDEIIAENLQAIEKVDRTRLPQLFGSELEIGPTSEAFMVIDSSQSAQPQLTYRRQSRPTVTTVDARIGIAQTTMVVDESGGYLAQVDFRVENRTEPYLEVILPLDARLWTVHVAGEPVKVAEAGSGSQHIRVPLIKTAVGDLDYPIELKYGGRIHLPQWWGKVHFPLLKTENIRVEQSQVRLYLPESLKWNQFGGTLGDAASEDQLQAGWLAFRAKQVSELNKVMNQTDKYSRTRAANTLAILESSDDFVEASGKSGELKSQIDECNDALATVQKQIGQQQVDATSEFELGNRARFDQRFRRQDNGRSLNVLGDIGQNFYANPQPAADGSAGIALQQSRQQSAGQSAPQRGDLLAEGEQLYQLNELAKKSNEPTQQADAVQQTNGFGLYRSERQSGRANVPQSQPRRMQDRKPDAEAAQTFADPFAPDDAQAPPPTSDLAYGGAFGSRWSYGDAGAVRPATSGAYGIQAPQWEMPGQPQSGGQPNSQALDSLNALGSASVASGRSGASAAASSSPAANNQPGSTSEGRNATAEGNARGLASLDVAIHSHGKPYFFSAAHGDVELEAFSVSGLAAYRGLAIAACLIVLTGVAVLLPVFQRMLQQRWFQVVLALMLVVVGIASIAMEHFSLWGIAAIVVATALALRPSPAATPVHA